MPLRTHDIDRWLYRMAGIAESFEQQGMAAWRQRCQPNDLCFALHWHHLYHRIMRWILESPQLTTPPLRPFHGR